MPLPLWLRRKRPAPTGRVKHPDFAVWEQRTSLNLEPRSGGKVWVAWFATYPKIRIHRPTAEDAVQELCYFLFERGYCVLALPKEKDHA